MGSERWPLMQQEGLLRCKEKGDVVSAVTWPGLCLQRQQVVSMCSGALRARTGLSALSATAVGR